MTPMKKPDWFQMAEADGPRPVRSIKRGARIAALVAHYFLLGLVSLLHSQMTADQHQLSRLNLLQIRLRKIQTRL